MNNTVKKYNMYKGAKVTLEGCNCELSPENQILYEKYSKGEKNFCKKPCEALIFYLKRDLVTEQMQLYYHKNKKTHEFNEQLEQEKKLRDIEQQRDKVKEDHAATTLFLKSAQIEIKQLKSEVGPLHKRVNDLEQQITEVRPLRLKLAELEYNLRNTSETINHAKEIVAECDGIVDIIGSIRN